MTSLRLAWATRVREAASKTHSTYSEHKHLSYHHSVSNTVWQPSHTCAVLGVAASCRAGCALAVCRHGAICVNLIPVQSWDDSAAQPPSPGNLDSELQASLEASGKVAPGRGLENNYPCVRESDQLDAKEDCQSRAGWDSVLRKHLKGRLGPS